MEYSIQDVAKAAGTTSRTLRHYDSIGLVRPSRVGHNGYRYYNNEALVRLQRVLLLRRLGLGLGTIGEVLAAQDEGAQPQVRILSDHLDLLRQEQERLRQQISSVERTIAALSAAEKKETDLMKEKMFEGFDHTQYQEEVESRWGRDAYASSNKWWSSLGSEEQDELQDQVRRLNADWAAAAEENEDPSSPTAQALAQRHVEWLHSVPGTPAHGGNNLAGYIRGLADMYVADERFAANYGGIPGATFVRDALLHYVQENPRLGN